MNPLASGFCSTLRTRARSGLGEQPGVDLGLDVAIRVGRLQLADDLARQRAQIGLYARY